MRRTSSTELIPLRITVLGLLLAAVASPFPAAGAESTVAVTVSAVATGRTPAVIAYNMGENLPGSNVTSWLRYSEMNGARFWWSQDAWPADPPAWRDGPNGLARFESERTRLRADPLGGADRAAHGATIAQVYGGVTPEIVGHCYSLSELHRLGTEVLVMMGRSPRRVSFARADGEPDWFGRWAYWRGVYLNAFYLAEHYGVARFQLFNEPDHPNSLPLTQAGYLERLQLGSDAVQAAVADVNRVFGRSLQVQVSAPVSAGLMVFQARSGRADTRDAATGWGELIMRHRHDDFPGRGDASWPLFHTYAFQNYGRDPGRIATGLPELRGLIAGANGGTALPIIVSEMNVSTAANFSKTRDTLDTPSYYAAFGAVAAAYVNAGIDEIYVFRLTQNAYEGAGGVKKNGTHFIRADDPLKNILGSTKGAEAVRLLMRGFKGARVRFAPPVAASADVHALAAREAGTGAYSLLLANLKSARTLAIDLRAWSLPAGALAVVDEVSVAHHGDVRQVQALPADGQLALPMAADAVTLLTIWPRLRAAPWVAAATRAEAGRWQLPAGALTEGRQFLAVRATAPATARVRVYGGTADPAHADLLGQITVGPAAGEALVDVTRYLTALRGNPAVFQFVPDRPGDEGNGFEVTAVELRAFGEGR
jgi:hypothetical protein